MAPRKRTAAVAKSGLDSSSAAPAVSPSPSQPQHQRRPPVLPLQHYVPRVSLQLAAILFALYTSINSDASPPSPLKSPASRVVDSLVDNPVKFLSTAVTALGGVQVWFGLWARSCRRAAMADKFGGGNATKQQAARERKGLKQVMKETANSLRKWELPRRPPTTTQAGGKLDLDFGIGEIPQALVTTLAFACLLQAGAIALGAPLFRNFLATLLLSLLISVLAILPLALTVPLLNLGKTSTPSNLSANRYTWLRLFSALTIQDALELALLAPALGAILGCWLGAIPIPLDWEMKWQAWPTTCVIGALVGHAIGSLTALVGCALFWREDEGEGEGETSTGQTLTTAAGRPSGTGKLNKSA